MPGFDIGGISWFSDLTVPAVSLHSYAVLFPMGVYGAILPLTVTGLMLANIDQAFVAPQHGELHVLRRLKCDKLSGGSWRVLAYPPNLVNLFWGLLSGRRCHGQRHK